MHVVIRSHTSLVLDHSVNKMAFHRYFASVNSLSSPVDGHTASRELNFYNLNQHSVIDSASEQLVYVVTELVAK